MQDRRQAGGQRAFVRGQELRRLFHRFAVAAEGARIRREIGIAQRRGDDAPGIHALLMHADRAVHAVVDQHDDDRQAVLNGGGEFLPVHQKVAVAGKADDSPLRKQTLRADRRRQAKTHRA